MALDESGAPDDSGFTLLEVLVAFIIASLALAILFQVGVEGLRSATTATRYQDALARAQSRLATISRDAPLQDSDRQGDDGEGYHWHTRITTAASAPLTASADRNAPRITLHNVEVAIAWGTRQVVLHTERASR